MYSKNDCSSDNRRTIVDISEYGYDLAIPDGMTIDKDGHLWVALMFEGTVCLKILITFNMLFEVGKRQILDLAMGFYMKNETDVNIS